ncbi:hypothetical protein NPIL_149541 [Nephila pilipes]|uniref:Uncharacterized protein n=1 Tax=Nephila pilipes TaxID=299642 RepID=A0A8X6TF43_NEPPI|nr:hypothetical protein NPIL_149541 [Nephila pilipes]
MVRNCHIQINNFIAKLEDSIYKVSSVPFSSSAMLFGHGGIMDSERVQSAPLCSVVGDLVNSNSGFLWSVGSYQNIVMGLQDS